MVTEVQTLDESVAKIRDVAFGRVATMQLRILAVNKNPCSILKPHLLSIVRPRAESMTGVKIARCTSGKRKSKVLEMCLCNVLQYAAKFRSTSMDLSWDGTSSFPESNNFHAHWWSLEGYEGDWWMILDRSYGLERSMVHTFEGRTQLKALAASILIFSRYGRRPSVYCKRHAGYCAGGIFFC